MSCWTLKNACIFSELPLVRDLSSDAVHWPADHRQQSDNANRQGNTEQGIKFPHNLSRWIPSSQCCTTTERLFSRNIQIKQHSCSQVLHLYPAKMKDENQYVSHNKAWDKIRGLVRRFRIFFFLLILQSFRFFLKPSRFESCVFPLFPGFSSILTLSSFSLLTPVTAYNYNHLPM